MRLRLSILVGLSAAATVAGLALFGPARSGHNEHPRGGLVASFAANALGPESASARLRLISVPFGIVSPAPVSANKRRVTATGPFGCDRGERWTVDIQLFQGRTFGQAHKAGNCSGKPGAWNVTVAARTKPGFGAGRARGCGLLLTLKGKVVTDSFQWCEDVILRGYR